MWYKYIMVCTHTILKVVADVYKCRYVHAWAAKHERTQKGTGSTFQKKCTGSTFHQTKYSLQKACVYQERTPKEKCKATFTFRLCSLSWQGGWGPHSCKRVWPQLAPCHLHHRAGRFWLHHLKPNKFNENQLQWYQKRLSLKISTDGFGKKTVWIRQEMFP